MMRSMFAADSGLRFFQTMMDVVGDNTANVYTVGPLRLPLSQVIDPVLTSEVEIGGDLSTSTELSSSERRSLWAHHRCVTNTPGRWLLFGVTRQVPLNPRARRHKTLDFVHFLARRPSFLVCLG